jgi:hypothetical protein
VATNSTGVNRPNSGTATRLTGSASQVAPLKKPSVSGISIRPSMSWISSASRQAEGVRRRRVLT